MGSTAKQIETKSEAYNKALAAGSSMLEYAFNKLGSEGNYTIATFKKEVEANLNQKIGEKAATQQTRASASQPATRVDDAMKVDG